MTMALLYITPTWAFFLIVSIAVLCHGACISIRKTAYFHGVKNNTLQPFNRVPSAATQKTGLSCIALSNHHPTKNISSSAFIAMRSGGRTKNNYLYGYRYGYDHNYYANKNAGPVTNV